ncbi:hypothetical protein Cme02nite_45270 [Catellatospora methionotrophica]|uniref:Uncharacterized protein n=1 Tax=Catellatospora methionotrophica TaxID=121620 RepID=A0A8J3LKI8_9ACTN|nr:hypothetical protein [Catellatospora methionotrophica]GIG16195.1 hypothetical protein Cme02nite_45270 [Catellatospora methionotrophica]
MSSHPAWCQIRHPAGQAAQGVHSRTLGDIPTADGGSVLVELNDRDDRGPLVSIGVTDEDGAYASADLDGPTGREVAALLGQAADLLAGGAR